MHISPMSSILILGAAGFTGRAMIKYLGTAGVAHTRRIVGVDRKVSQPVEGIVFIEADLVDGAGIRSVLRDVRPEFVFNFAGAFGSDNLPALIRANVLIVAELLEATVACGQSVRRVLLVGSAAEYGAPKQLPVSEDAALAPVTAYGVSKMMQSGLARFYYQHWSVPVVIARAFNLIGPGLSEALSLGAFEKRIREAQPGGSIRVGNIESRRDFVNVSDAVEQYWRIATCGEPGEVYNVCSGKPTRVGDVVEAMIRESGKDLRIEADPDLFRADDVAEIYGDNRKLRALDATT
jgi:GDP-4-dehydro-6-deoxy-D-mannose reductase